MALNAIYLRLIINALTHVRKSAGSRRLNALALGYPDLIATRDEIKGVIPELPDASLVPRADSEAITTRHGVGGPHSTVYDIDRIFSDLGLAMTYIDIAPARGIERQVDLNEPFPSNMIEAYDIVIDAGTIEHCFNLGQAFKNVSQSVSQYGVIVQAAPLNRYNHGFWNFSPTAYHDYFTTNGYAILYLKGWCGGVVGDFKEFDVDPVAGFRSAPENSALICVCQRTKVVPHGWPVQWKYRTPSAGSGDP